MRIVCVADTHLFQKDLGELPKGDVFIHAGDLLRGGSLSELEQVVPWLESLTFTYKIVIAGNHDRCIESDPVESIARLGSNVIYLEDSEAIIDGVRFWGSPWQPEYLGWAFNLPRGEPLASKWRLIPEHTDVLITHGPPRGFGDYSGMPERLGCNELLNAIRTIRPALHIFGHIHQDGGFWRDGETCLANVTTWESTRKPTVIDLDPTTMKVDEVTVPPPRRS